MPLRAVSHTRRELTPSEILPYAGLEREPPECCRQAITEAETQLQTLKLRISNGIQRLHLLVEG